MKPIVLVLTGPTAVGKTELSCSLARRLGGEIVSADSVQIYQSLDIGSAKPSLQVRQEIPHHLIDRLSLAESFDVVAFYREAHQTCHDILARGNQPIVVGGSGFYLDTFLNGLPKGPPPNPSLRLHLKKELQERGASQLYRELAEQDPLYAATLSPNDHKKLLRALEIYRSTGHPPSHFAGRKPRTRTYDLRTFVLHRPRSSLYARIDQRCLSMLEQGFLDEVRALQRGGFSLDSPASKAIGYRQALLSLTEETEEEEANFLATFQKVSRHYAKRQLTWLRKKFPPSQWLDIEQLGVTTCEEKILHALDI